MKFTRSRTQKIGESCKIAGKKILIAKNKYNREDLRLNFTKEKYDNKIVLPVK